MVGFDAVRVIRRNFTANIRRAVLPSLARFVDHLQSYYVSTKHVETEPKLSRDDETSTRISKAEEHIGLSRGHLGLTNACVSGQDHLKLDTTTTSTSK